MTLLHGGSIPLQKKNSDLKPELKCYTAVQTTKWCLDETIKLDHQCPVDQSVPSVLQIQILIPTEYIIYVRLFEVTK